ncbi:alpha/beta hydrolase [Rhizobium sp. 18065]|uniref:alpha/beta hydrolase n=1 Tax=Rhizobium sp. 18065 TaxID=2681411 RepID=UPI001357CF85|nr:alpha/beta hydrolase [Rhizobium sp. 18065]
MPDPNTPEGPKGIYVLPLADVGHVKNIHRDIAYADASSFQTLDLYLPEGTAPAKGWPLVIFVHGGAWMMCDKRDIQLNAPLKLLDHGFALASINYRLSSEARFPAQIRDVKAAIRCLRGKAVDLGIDPALFCIWGASAGAHLAMLAGTSAGVPVLEDRNMGWPEESAEVQAVISWFGPTDFLKMDDYFAETLAGTADHSDADSPESKLLGGKITDIPGTVRAANPETWLTPDCPPFLFQHAPKDPIVPVQHSVHFAHLINSVAGPGTAHLRFVENAGHAGPEFERDDVINDVIEFLTQLARR